MKKFILHIILIFATSVGFSQVSSNFTVSKSSGCAPLVVNFLDLSTGSPSSWLWDFGNGTISSQQNPTFVFAKPGFYTVQLTVSDGTTTDTETKSALIRVNAPPTPAFTVNQAKGCSPHLAQFTDLSVPQSGTVTNWYWAFGNGQTSTQQNPTTTYSEIKSYDVYLKITDVNGCSSTISKSDYIELDGPEAKFVYDSVVCGLPANILFLNQSSGNNLEYKWSFGDGATSTSEVPGTHTYTSFDSTEVQLIVTEKSTGCADTVTNSLVVGNYEATFDYDITCGDDEFLIEVENTTEVFAQLEWDFAGESSQFTANAAHQFSGKGPYSITLKATVDESCWDTTTLVYNLPLPAFDYNADKCSNPFNVEFNNTSKGKDLTFDWAFGDSTFSSESTPLHTFQIPPELYRTWLYATDKFGCLDSTSRYVQVPFPIARFNELNDKFTGCVPLDLTFQDTSYTLNSSVSSVKWDFGDPASGANNFSTSLNPSHSYTVPGDYDITYIIFTDDGCSDTAVFENKILAGEKPSAVDFSFNPNDTVCFGETINFTHTETYPTALIESNTFCWSFHDGSTPLLTDIEKLPEPCPIYKNYGTQFSSHVSLSEPNHTYSFIDNGIDTIAQDSFASGDIETISGDLNVHFITGYNNCFAEIIKPNYVHPTVAANGYVLADSIAMFSDSSKIFGFYNASLNFDISEYSYVSYYGSSDTLFKFNSADTIFEELQEGKKYVVRNKVSSTSNNCENSIDDIIIIDSVRLDFEIPERVCLNDNSVLLDDNSYSKYGYLTNRTWEIHGATINSTTNDSAYYTFPDTGVFTVVLKNTYRIRPTFNGKIIDNSYTKSTSKQIKIEGVKAKGVSDTLLACGSDTIFFTDSSASTNLLKDYTWRFGYEADSSVSKNTNHVYDNAGLYKPTLVVTDTFGCRDSILLPSIFITRPSINFEESDTLICKHDVIAFKNKSQGNSLSFTWTIDTIQQLNIDIVHKFDSVGIFDVKLHAVDGSGCQDSLIKQGLMTVEDFPSTLFNGSPLYIDCPPLNSFFKDSTVTPVIKWEWNFGNGKTSTEQNPSHIYTTPGLYDVQLITTNYAGCSDTLIKEKLVEIDGPNGAITFSKDTLCIPDSILFDLNFKNTVHYIFNFGDGEINSFSFNPDSLAVSHSYTNGGTFQPSVELIDASGCFYSLPQLPIVNADSIAARFSTSSNIICDVANIPFTNKSRSTLPSSFIWKMGDGTSLTENSPVHTYVNDSNYTIVLIQNSPLGCIDSVQKTIKVFNAPYPTISIENENFCIPSLSEAKIIYKNTNFSPDSTIFLIDQDLKFNTDSFTTNIISAGAHKFNFLIYYGSGNCLIDSTVNVEFYEWPIAKFNFTPQNNSLEEPVVFFQNTSEFSDKWIWDFDDLEQSTVKNPGHNFNMQGVYNVQLIASNNGGCSDTTLQEVTMSPYNFVKLPSAFSPNGDGENETFGILRAGELEIEIFKIYNRWGNIVFETTDKNEEWDGTRNGKEQNIGTYIYYVKGTNKKGETVEIKGNFTLLR